MATNPNTSEPDALHRLREDLAAALSQSDDWLGMLQNSDAPEPLLGGMYSASMPFPPAHPGGGRAVTAGVTGKDGISADEAPVEAGQHSAVSAIPTQLRINVPLALADALKAVPKHKRSRAFAAAAFGDLGSTPDASAFVSAAVQLERAGIILQQALHLGLAGALEKEARSAIRWIERVCRLRRDDSISMCFRLPPEHMRVLLQLKPRFRGDFVRRVAYCARAGISPKGLIAGEHLIRIACDCIVWHLNLDPVVPSAEVVPLLIALQSLRQGGAS